MYKKNDALNYNTYLNDKVAKNDISRVYQIGLVLVVLASMAGCGKGLSELQTHPDPKASDFAVSVDEDAAIEITTQEVLAHVTDDKNLNLEVVALRGGSLGVLSRNDLGYTYTTNENANGVDVLSYEVKDSANVAAGGEIRITINPKSDLPQAQQLSIQTSEDVSLDIKKSEIKDRTSDPDPGDYGTVVSLQSANATIPVIIEDRGDVYRVTPPLHFNGILALTYKVEDRTQQAAFGQIELTVRGINNPPTVANITATTNEDTDLIIPIATFLAAATDVDANDSLIMVQNSVVGGAKGVITVGDLSVSYKPNSDANGKDIWSFSIRDSGGLESEANLEITIVPVNDVPLAGAANLSLAEDGAFDVDYAAVSGSVNDVDIGDVLSLKLVSGGAHGSVANSSAGKFRYTPIKDYFGEDTLRYTIKDQAGLEASADLKVVVTAVNDTPMTNDFNITVAEDMPYTITASEVLGSGHVTDVDTAVSGLSLVSIERDTTQNSTYTLAVGAVGYVFTPALNSNLPEKLKYTVSDGLASKSGYINIAITAVQDAPVAASFTLAGKEDQAVKFTVADVLAHASDPDGDVLNLNPLPTPANGTLTLVGTEYTYQPVPNYYGQDAISFVVKDSANNSSVASGDADV